MQVVFVNECVQFPWTDAFLPQAGDKISADFQEFELIQLA